MFDDRTPEELRQIARALEDMIVRGVSSVTGPNGVTLTYRSAAEVRRALADVRGALARAEPAVARPRVRRLVLVP